MDFIKEALNFIKEVLIDVVHGFAYRLKYTIIVLGFFCLAIGIYSLFAGGPLAGIAFIFLGLILISLMLFIGRK